MPAALDTSITRMLSPLDVYERIVVFMAKMVRFENLRIRVSDLQTNVASRQTLTPSCRSMVDSGASTSGL